MDRDEMVGVFAIGVLVGLVLGLFAVALVTDGYLTAVPPVPEWITYHRDRIEN